MAGTTFQVVGETVGELPRVFFEKFCQVALYSRVQVYISFLFSRFPLTMSGSAFDFGAMFDQVDAVSSASAEPPASASSTGESFVAVPGGVSIASSVTGGGSPKNSTC